MEPIITENQAEIERLCREHHVRRLDVFGSVCRGDFTEASDVDFLVEFDENVSANRFDNFFELHERLGKLLKRRVDLVEPGGLSNPYFIRRIEQTRRTLYVAS
jgi:predicted nucleotidyltransferase